MFDANGERKYLNWPERQAFFQAVKKEPDPFMKALCLAFFFTGARISEVLGLTWERIDFSNDALILETLKQRKRGVFRSIPIPDTLLDELKELEIPPGSNGRVWPMSRSTAYRIVKVKMAAAGIIGVRACPKGLRHSFAIAHLTRYTPVTVVQKWMGHARLETTLIYLNVLGEDERKFAKRLWRLR